MLSARATTPEQKRAIIERLYTAWLRVDKLRLGQLIHIARPLNTPDTFYVEDDDLLRRIEELAQ